MPRRIQRGKTRRWRMPPNTRFVGRPSRWANPFRVGVHGPRSLCLALYRDYAQRKVAQDIAWILPLRGKDLCCRCGLHERCHADVLLELANPHVRKKAHPSERTRTKV